MQHLRSIGCMKEQSMCIGEEFHAKGKEKYFQENVPNPGKEMLIQV